MSGAFLRLPQPYDLESTLLGGQAFRWRRDGTAFVGFIGNKPTRIAPQRGGAMVTMAGGGDPVREAGAYLRATDALPAIYTSIAKDGRMRSAVEQWKGLHLLSQDPWETLIAFIASSASNVPKISRSLEKVARRYGDEVRLGGNATKTFPTPGALARADLAGLRACELGYRAKYILATARRVAEREVDLEAIAKKPTDAAQQALVEACDGIGPKVAACVALFSMGKDDAFPVDRWVRRCVSEWYLGGEKVSNARCEAWGREYFGPYAGYAQQYLFHERRSRGRASD